MYIYLNFQRNVKPQTRPTDLKGDHTEILRRLLYNHSLEPDLVFVPLHCSVRLLITVSATLLQYNYIIHY
jgi:hypothetical protein